jgi:hypothetical protein
MLSSGFRNDTFRKIISLRSVCYGSVMCVDTADYSNFVMDRCIFAQCNATFSGAIHLGTSTFFFPITRSRFEDNYSTRGLDIGIHSNCYSNSSNKELTSSSCSLSGPPYSRVMCLNNYLQELWNNCSDDIVLQNRYFFL